MKIPNKRELQQITFTHLSLTGGEIPTSNQKRVMGQAKFTYEKLWKNKQKTIEDQGKKHMKATEEHRKQLAESNALVKKMKNNKKYANKKMQSFFICKIFILLNFFR